MNYKGDVSFILGYFLPKIRGLFTKNKVIARERRFMYSKPFMDVEDAHKLIKDFFNGDKPVMIARFGFTEAPLTGRYLLSQNPGIVTRNPNIMKNGNWLYDTAGFFSQGGVRTQSDIEKFARLMVEDAKQADLIGASYALLEDYVINECCINAKITEFDNLRIMVCEDSWGEGLSGKKVLVISPFSESIRKQYARKDKIWSNPKILPDFTLIPYRAVQTIAGNNTDQYIDWFDALDKMKKDIAKIDFDIAIIGCGAYGFPLAAECKRLGKKAIHLGGQTQMCFGVLGKRWEDIPYYKQFINEYWVHPSDDEKPDNFKTVENGCYW